MEEQDPATSASKRKRTRLSIEDALAAIGAVTAALEESYRLTDMQEAAIAKCFQLIQKTRETMQSSVKSQKSSRPMIAYQILHDIRSLIGLKPFLLCALALQPSRMQTMTKDDAAKFPSKLQIWWESSKHSSEKLEALARKFESMDKVIPHISPGVPLCLGSGENS